MNETFDDMASLAESRYGEAFSPQGDGAFSVAIAEGAVAFLRAAGDPASAFVRARILSMDEVERAGDFAHAALAGNFFWGGTRGATLSVGADNALYATERRLLDELANADGLAQCLDDFGETISDWRERSALYA
jgi:hypothetical protein